MYARAVSVCRFLSVCVCVCVWDQLAVGSGILLPTEAPLGIYKDAKREKENAALVGKIN